MATTMKYTPEQILQSETDRERAAARRQMRAYNAWSRTAPEEGQAPSAEHLAAEAEYDRCRENTRRAKESVRVAQLVVDCSGDGHPVTEYESAKGGSCRCGAKVDPFQGLV